tara:strand:- start:173 stop:457 length:285 start_codon:yes stop_codon:yes gene_type:complete
VVLVVDMEKVVTLVLLEVEQQVKGMMEVQVQEVPEPLLLAAAEVLVLLVVMEQHGKMLVTVVLEKQIRGVQAHLLLTLAVAVVVQILLMQPFEV